MTDKGSVFQSVTLVDLTSIAKYIAERINACKIWLFRGEMGSGKTTLIKEICRAQGVTEVMSSPTFSIVNEYPSHDSGKIYHFDFYRIKNELEAIDIGIEEYFYSGYPCLVEWPEKIPSLIPPSFAEVTIQVETNTKRTIAIAIHDGKKENRI
jgi:tRNA threonylcarbamoyladenosine biosynthesis protein TsaE